MITMYHHSISCRNINHTRNVTAASNYITNFIAAYQWFIHLFFSSKEVLCHNKVFACLDYSHRFLDWAPQQGVVRLSPLQTAMTEFLVSEDWWLEVLKVSWLTHCNISFNTEMLISTNSFVGYVHLFIQHRLLWVFVIASILGNESLCPTPFRLAKKL